MFAILAKLRGLKTSSDYAETLPALERELAGARDKLAALKVRLRSAAFDEDAAGLEAIRHSIRDTEYAIELLEGTIEETSKRRDAADEAERLAQAREVIAEAREAYRASAKAWQRYDEHVAALDGLIREIESHDETIRQANGQADRLGFPGEALRRITPTSGTASLVNQLRKSSCSHVYRDRPEPITRDARSANLVAAGHAPAPFNP